MLGVKAIVYPNLTERHFALKVIDTRTGAISASVYAVYNLDKSAPTDVRQIIEDSIDALHAETTLIPFD